MGQLRSYIDRNSAKPYWQLSAQHCKTLGVHFPPTSSMFKLTLGAKTVLFKQNSQLTTLVEGISDSDKLGMPSAKNEPNRQRSSQQAQLMLQIITEIIVPQLIVATINMVGLKATRSTNPKNCNYLTHSATILFLQCTRNSNCELRSYVDDDSKPS